MTGEELKQFGIAFFGSDGWQSGLAEALDINRSTVWRYVSNNSVPGPVAGAVLCWKTHGLPAPDSKK